MARIGPKLNDFLDGFSRQDSPAPTRSGATSHSSGGSSTKVETKGHTFDQKAINQEVQNFNAKGQSSGHKTSADTPEENLSSDIIEYRAKHQAAFETHKASTLSKKLLEQPVSGRVNGKEVEPFSSSQLKQNSEALVKTDATAPTPFHFKTALKSAAVVSLVGFPITITAFVIINAINQIVNLALNPIAPAVERSKDDIFQVLNTLRELHGQPSVSPSPQWLAQTDNERLDVLEDMVDYIEQEVGAAAKQLGIPFQLASTGALQDDIDSRTNGIQSRLAVVSSLFREMENKLKTRVG